ncbi:heavy metal-binding domain-containing protein [Leekyejoonella antrihumi]|uniref:Heavy metal-binding domain-containing protein n=1 Tax=Leekyejoonella antrihumi TaxID=1660198 RepID=A0A563E7L8_9MICO|nr:heavy metal-binding domain-containing protein [Leekyejoonella antrihumi]TWP38507.1 heavy metal-binding domain-containing protein [Leekyejoonella antrihumi]
MPFKRPDTPPAQQAAPGTPGTLPSAAQERVARLAAREHQDNAAFTSDLSVNEFVLVHQLGFDPVGYVMGTSIYHVGFQAQRWNRSMELDVLTSAMQEARYLAIERMRTEAHALGADGVVGVHLKIQRYAWQNGEMEFIAEGTAVRAREPNPSYKLRDGGPFTSDLSGQDFYTLVRHGHFPRAFVFGVCVYHVAAQSMRQNFSMAGRNMEVPNFTEATYTARELAMTRMEDEANRANADGIVGVTTNVNAHIWGEHATEFLSIGTGVVSSPEVVTDPPTMTLSLDD